MNHKLKFKILVIFLLLFQISASIFSQEKKIQVHDPVMIKQAETFYLFCTGMGISVWSSKDMVQWQKEKQVFEKAPAWAVEAIPGYRGHTWAPDISFHNGFYYLYYSVSAFGKNTSCIGVTTNKTLNPADPDYHWEDHGKVVQSVPGRDMWNAIDPNLMIDDSGTPWLVFGSFWEGMKLVKLDQSLVKVAEPQEWHTVAARPRDYYTDEKNAGEGSIEAPFLFKKGKFYFLFVSFDFCCRGIESNYKIMAGRSEQITGPYLDRNGRDMKFGGGTPVLTGNKDWPGVGHNAVYTFDGQDFIIYHGYDAKDQGRSKLLIDKLNWDDEGWPMVEQSIKE
ncbi:MAG: arabinan endo-1,5-alpha-L-arabinosidase [Bacteroidales bacterium]|nr:arabinan endo-1,5-alpha-L-arabinosidase [Bacteroidales bacterium]